MTPQRKVLRAFSTSVLVAVFAGFASPALAIDAEDFAAKLNAAYGLLGSRFSYDTATTNGTDVTLGSVKQRLPGHGEIELGDLIFEEVSEPGDGSYMVKRLGYSDFSLWRDEAEISISGLELSGIRIPGTPDDKTQSQMISYERAKSGPVSVKLKGDQVFSMASFESAMSPQPNNAGYDLKASGDGVVINLDPGLEKVGYAKSREIVSELGYGKLRGDLKLELSWERGTGRIHAREYAFDVDDAGRLNMAFDISGYTPQFIKAIGRAESAAASNPEPLAAQQELEAARIRLLQQLTFTSGSIRFDDASLTRKMLATAGRKQGVSGEQMAQGIKFMMPLLLWRVGIPALQQQIAAAASVYLDNPQNIKITANPASPVAVPMIMGAGKSDPRQLVDLLNVQITANEPVLLCCKE